MTATTAAHTNCGRCGRRLTDPKSRAAGYGPVCLARVKSQTAHYDIDQTVRAVALTRSGEMTRVPGRPEVLYRIERAPYLVHWTTVTECTCEGFQARGDCYHIEAVRIASTRRRYATAA